MNQNNYVEAPEIDREKLLSLLVEELPVLRAKIGLSQGELSDIIGVSRQTYSAIETRKRKMTWNTFLSIVLVFGYNEKTSDVLESCGAFPKELRDILNTNNRKEGQNGTADS